MVVLISFIHPWAGAVEAKCAACNDTVYEHQANLDKMKESDGVVICVVCAMKIKIEFPDLFPTVDAQLWDGHVRRPEVAPGLEPLIDFLNDKRKS